MRLRRFLPVWLLLLLLLAACREGTVVAPAFGDPDNNETGNETNPILNDLETLDTLKTEFNKDTGSIRLILLLSPT